MILFHWRNINAGNQLAFIPIYNLKQMRYKPHVVFLFSAIR